MAIRYDKKLNQEIRKVINNYNAKIRRIEKYDDSFNYQLPEKITKKDLQQNVYTRNELRRKLNELKRYSQRDIEKSMQLAGGYVLSRYEYENLKREKARVKRNISRELTRLETEKPRVFGKLQSMTFAQMGDSYYLNLKAKREQLEKQIESLNSEEFKRYEKLVYKTGRSQEYQTSLFRDNYEKMLTDLGYYTGYDKDKLQLLKEKLRKLNNRQFYKLFQNERAIKSITEYYPLVTNKTIKGFNPDDIKEDVANLYNNLIENIDEIIGTL